MRDAKKLSLNRGVTSGLALDVRGGNGGFRIDAAFQAGQGVTALFGASGAGKTTLLRMIAGTLRPQSGTISINGTVLFDSQNKINLPPEKRHIGYVYQDARLFPHMSVQRNLTYAQWAGGRGAGRESQHKPEHSLDTIVELLGLEALLQRKPQQLSGGEKQRVAIGRALLSAPQLLLLDEPLSSLDHARRQEILPYLERLRDESGLPIVLVSHEVDEVARLADTLVLLDRGTVRQSGSVFDLFSQITGDDADASVLLQGEVLHSDNKYALAEIAIGGGDGGQHFQLTDYGLQSGMQVRLRIHARDVSLARHLPTAISIRNVFPALICDITEQGEAFAEISLQLGDTQLLSRISRKSLQDMQLQIGEQVFALIKAVSIDRSAARFRHK